MVTPKKQAQTPTVSAFVVLRTEGDLRKHQIFIHILYRRGIISQIGRFEPISAKSDA